MPAGNRRPGHSGQAQQHAVNDAPCPRRIVQGGDQEDDADRYDGDALEDAQRAGIEQQHVLREQREAHEPATDREADEIEHTP